MSERLNPDRYYMQELEPTRILQDAPPDADTAHALGAAALDALEHRGNESNMMKASQPDSIVLPDAEITKDLGATALDAVENNQKAPDVETERFQPYMETVSANAISGVDTSDPNFWNHHGYDKQNYMQLAERLPEVQSRIQQGATYDELRSDPELAATARAYYGPDNPITVEKQADGSFTFGSDGRHRIAAAQELGYDVDTQVIYDYGLPPGNPLPNDANIDAQPVDFDTETPFVEDILLKQKAQDLADQADSDASFEDNIEQVEQGTQQLLDPEIDSPDAVDMITDEQSVDQADDEMVFDSDIEQTEHETKEAVNQEIHDELVDGQPEENESDTVDHSDLIDVPANESFDRLDLDGLSDESTVDVAADTVECSDIADNIDAGIYDDSSFDTYDATLDGATEFVDGSGDSFV